MMVILLNFYHLLLFNASYEIMYNTICNTSTGNTVQHKGHDLVSITYHIPTACEVCTRPLWHMFRPPQAYECRRESASHYLSYNCFIHYKLYSW